MGNNVNMSCSRTLIVLLLQLLLPQNNNKAGVLADDQLTLLSTVQEVPKVSWIFGDNLLTRNRRGVIVEAENDNTKYIIKNSKCQEDLKRLCDPIDNNNDDDLFILECAQTFKVNNQQYNYLSQFLT